VSDAEDAIDACEDATEAANDATDAANNAAESANDAASAANDAASAANTAANTLNTMLENIDAVPTQNSNNLVKSGGVYTALAGKQNTLTFDNAPTAGSNNPVNSGGIKTAIDNAVAAVAKKNVYLVKHDADWVSETSAHGATTLTATELRAMMPDNIFAIQIKVVNYDLDSHVITLVESFRDEGSNIIYFRTSETVDKRMYVGSMDIDGIGKGDISIDILTDESPLMLHVDEITIDDDDITSISFIESAKQIFDAVGVRPLEVIIENDDKKYHLREWSNWTEIIEAPTQTFVKKCADLTAQDPTSNQFVCLRLRAQHAQNVYAVTGDGVFNVRG
jgi:hypothetical protein